MNKTSGLSQGLTVILITLLLGAVTLTLWAQTEDQESAEPSPPEQQETEATSSTSEADSEETVADDSPFDYQSSEEISEDLSVKFPVDI
jgi:hypothetical protein